MNEMKNILLLGQKLLSQYLYLVYCQILKINSISKSTLRLWDGAQSFGSGSKKNKWKFIDIGCTSFYPTKNLGCFGDGGAIFTNNKEIAKKCVLIRAHGETKDITVKYWEFVEG